MTISTSDAAFAMKGMSECDPTIDVTLGKMASILLAFSAERTIQRMSNESKSGRLANRVKTEPPTYPVLLSKVF
jgi:hypothetical protein